MPVGAVLGAAAIGGVATTVASSKNSKAINKAADAQSQSSAEQVALQREIYGKNEATLAPYVQRGNAAGDTMNALLGLGGTPQPSALSQFLPTPQSGALSPMAYGGSDGMMDEGALREYYGATNPQALRDYGNMKNDSINWQALMANFGAPVSAPQPQQAPQATQAPSNVTTTPQQAAASAYEVFKQSTGYQDRLKEGYRGVNANYAGSGLLQSGAAQKALLRYGQQQASNEFGNYMGYLGNQQGVGLSGASALAGVGQSYANSVGNISAANAQMTGQAAIARANNSNAMLGGIGNIVGNTVGALSSYGQQPMFPQQPPVANYGGSGANMTGAIWNYRG